MNLDKIKNLSKALSDMGFEKESEEVNKLIKKANPSSLWGLWV